VARIEPVEPPYEPEVAARLTAMMPAGVDPIGLFRTFVRNVSMATAMARWGGYELSKQLSLSLRQREIVINRTCARCRCEYEWGVHVAFFAEQAQLTAAQVSSLTHGTADDECWDALDERALVEAVDQLHNTGTIDDELWARLTAHFRNEQLLDVTMLCGWYHAISFTANAAAVRLEHGAPRFADIVAT
jgi:alkylhydroperoxidase family enzyme